MEQPQLLNTGDYSSAQVKPLVKWAGGKTQLLPEIIPKLPKSFNRYHEIFLGGGAVFFALGRAGSVATDINGRLINLYKQVRETPESFMKACKELEIEYNLASIKKLDQQASAKEILFQNIRLEFNGTPDNLRSAVLFLFLNKTCFNGLYRENSEGRFNVPFGQRTHLKMFDSSNILLMSRFLETSSLYIRGFHDAVAAAEEGDFIYADPPYVPLQSTPSFTSYHETGFGLAEQVALRNSLRDAGNRGVKFMVSNSNTQLVHDLYGDFSIEEVAARRSVGAKPGSRGQVKEVLIRNYFEP
jgi:DNA adenine methylase